MSARRNLLLPDEPRWPADRPVLELSGVHRVFGERVVLRGLDLTIPTGQTTVIAGESGSGKSVLLRLMNGLTFADQGVVRLFGVDLRATDERTRARLRKRCTMVFQSYALIDSMTVAENVAFPIVQNMRMPRPEVERRVREILEMFELGDAYGRLPAELSGGMRKRVALARALVTQPEVVLFDEPTTGLDPVMIERVDDLLVRTRALFGITSVIISHDMASNRRLADQLAILALGRVVAAGTYAAVVADPHPAVRRFVDSAQSSRLAPAADAAPPTPALPCEVSVPATWAPPPDLQPPVAEVIGLHKRFGNNHVLRGIDLTIPRGQITVIIGGSGSGKSVLVKHISGLLAPDAGDVVVLGERWSTLRGRPREALRAKIGMLFQGAALFDSMTIGENLAFPLVEGQRMARAAARVRVAEVAEATALVDILHRYPAEVSNGERKRAGLARALATRPEIMVYDEPTTGQDPLMMRRVDDMIVETNERFGITSIVISHDMASTFRIADKIALIHQGILVAAAPPEALRRCPDPRVQAFVFAGSSQ